MFTFSADDNPVGTYRIANYIVTTISHPVPAIEVLLGNPVLGNDAGFTLVVKSLLNWPTTLNGDNNKVSMPLLMFYILFLAPDPFVSLSFAWDTVGRLQTKCDSGAELNPAERVFVTNVVPWLEAPIINSVHVDDALACGRYDVQFVVSIGNQRLKAVCGDDVIPMIDAAVTQQWSIHQTTPFYTAFQTAVQNAIIQVEPVTAEPTPRGGADYILDNSVSFVSTARDKTIALFLILFSEELDFLTQWIEGTVMWREHAGVPSDAVEAILERLDAATRVPIRTPHHFEVVDEQS